MASIEAYNAVIAPNPVSGANALQSRCADDAFLDHAFFSGSVGSIASARWRGRRGTSTFRKGVAIAQTGSARRVTSRFGGCLSESLSI